MAEFYLKSGSGFFYMRLCKLPALQAMSDPIDEKEGSDLINCTVRLTDLTVEQFEMPVVGNRTIDGDKYTVDFTLVYDGMRYPNPIVDMIWVTEDNGMFQIQCQLIRGHKQYAYCQFFGARRIKKVTPLKGEIETTAKSYLFEPGERPKAKTTLTGSFVFQVAFEESAAPAAEESDQ